MPFNFWFLRASARTTGVLPAFSTHLDCLETLAIMGGRTDLTMRIQSLQAEVTSLRMA